MGLELQRSKAWINGLCIAALAVAVLVKDQWISSVIAFACCGTALVVLYRNLAKLSNVSEDNPKVKTLRSVTVFTVIYVAAVVLIAVGEEMLEKNGVIDELSQQQSKLLLALILAVPMTVLGNASPKLPFNRYTGLRLPWTVRDEETWIVAHRILGWISFPLALLLFVHVPTNMGLDDYAECWFLGIMLLWIGIPGALSGLFYYRKYRGRLD